MKQEEFCRQLAAVTPEMPEQFVQHIDHVLEHIVEQDEVDATHKIYTGSFMGSSISKHTVVMLIALMLMLMGLTAYALTQWNIFEHLSFIVGDHVPESANELMQSNLHQQTINNVVITVQEAGYDGRTLFLQYSYRILDIDEPLGVTAKERYGSRLPADVNPDSFVSMKCDAMALITKYNIDWWTDEFWINGESVMMPSGSGSIDTGSSVPGEIIHTEYWRLDNENIALDGVVEITLPIGNKEDGGLTFSFDAKEVQKQVITTQEKYRAEFGSFSATVTEATFTPLMTYITVEYHDAEVEQMLQEYGDWWPFGTDNDCFAWVYNLELVDQNGEPIYNTSYSAESVSATEASFYLPYVSTSYDKLWLAPVYNGKGDMSQAIRVR